MKCPRCQHENPPQAKFCLECGARVALTCTRCRSELPAGAKFCLECGAPLASQATAEPRFTSPESYTPKHLAEKILTSKVALEGERKQVTVLFADLKGSMELLADRDPEEARKLLDPVLERMMEAVHRYEGTVNQVMGDGIMALFGAPLAQEDHAIRACYAALRLQETVRLYAEEVRRAEGIPLQIRVGLNSGEVVVRSVGSDLRMDYTAVGQTTHLAARMEQMATPGTILLTCETLALAEGFVQVTPLGPMGVKGLPSPIEVFELTSASHVRSRLQAAAARGLTRFVGRDAEIELLSQALERAGGGRGQVVAVVGEPGVGKSRLVWEFTHSHRTSEWLVLEGASVSYSKATTYFPVIELLKRYFQIEARDDARKIREKLTSKLLSLDRRLEPKLPVLLSLLDIPVDDPEWARLDPSQRQRQTLDTLKRLLLSESQAQPVLLVFEDLHWIDSETQALLDILIEGVPTARVLLLISYRPEYTHAWGSKTYYQQLRLDVLPAANADELLDALVGLDASLRAIKPLLIERTEGNPFFLEEAVRELAEIKTLVGERAAYRLAGPIQSLQLPATTQAIIAARIDRLASGDKRLLQAAAVVGKDVPVVLLQAIAEDSEEQLHAGLARLRAAEFLYEAALFPEVEYTFKHALTHEVTYCGLLRERRRDLHARIFDAIEKIHQDRLGEQIERLALHAVRGEMWGRAVMCCRQAGLKMFARTANTEAVRYFDEALSALRYLPDNPETKVAAADVRFELRLALQPLGQLDRALEVLQEAEEIAHALRDDRRLGRAWLAQSNLVWVTRSIPRAVELAERALAVAQRSSDVALGIAANYTLGATHGNAGNFARAIECLAACLGALSDQLARERFGLPLLPAVGARAFLAMAQAFTGNFAACPSITGEAIRIAKAQDHPYSIAFAGWGCGTCLSIQGEFELAIQVLRNGAEIAHEWSIPFLWPLTTGMLGYALVFAGRTHEGVPLLEQALARADAMAFRNASSFLMPRMSEAYLRAGRVAEAGRSGERALSTARERGERAYEAEALWILGAVASARDRSEFHAAKESYDLALTLAKDLGMRPLVAHCHLGLGKLYLRTGKREQAQEHLTTAATMYREMGMTYWLEKAEAEPQF
jgi:class 3 adenylate cyclase/tetratricopeptide (TPR) repeat protein